MAVWFLQTIGTTSLFSMLYVGTLKLFAVLFVSCACVFAQEADPIVPRVNVSEIYLAKDDGTGKAGEAATAFETTDVPIHCVVQLDSAESVTVKMQLVAVNVPGVKPGTKVVATSYTTKISGPCEFLGQTAGTMGRRQLSLRHLYRQRPGRDPRICGTEGDAGKAVGE
jgi:hypothetical protein